MCGTSTNRANKSPKPTEWHGKSQLIVQYRASIHVVEMMVMLESSEASASHCVLKKSRPFKFCDQAFMHLREAELPSGP